MADGPPSLALNPQSAVPLAWHTITAACSVSVVCLIAGRFVVNQLSRSPMVLAAACGLLVGIAMLVVLPDVLADGRVPPSRAFTLFLIAPICMYVIEHAVIGHQHGPASQVAPLSPAALVGPAAEPEAPARATEQLRQQTPPVSLHASPPASPPPPPLPDEALDLDMMCLACDEEPPSEDAPVDVPVPTAMSRSDRKKADATRLLPVADRSEPVAQPSCTCGRGDGSSGSNLRTSDVPVRRVKSAPGPRRPRRQMPAGWDAFWGIGQTCTDDCCRGLSLGLDRRASRTSFVDGRVVATELTPADVEAGEAEAEVVGADDTSMVSMLLRMARSVGAVFRLCAWLTHGMLDGAILGGASSVESLLPLAFAISVCAVQDVAAFSVFLQQRRTSQRGVAVAIVAFAAAFPAGAAVSLAAEAELHHSAAWDSVRCCIAGLFVYMGLFELAPPHTHVPAQVIGYTLAFSAGAGAAYAAEYFEESYSHR